MFDDLKFEELARKRSVKWARDPDDVLAAWVADMDFPIAPPIKRAMQDVLDTDDLGYPGYDMRDAVRQAFVDRMATRFDWHIEMEDTWLLTTVVQGLHFALTIGSAPGDGVVVQMPIYTPFLNAIDQLGRRRVEAPLGRDGDRYVMDADILESAIDETTTVLMLCNPHNPTGRVFTVDELTAIAEVAERHDLLVIADEIHQDLLHDDNVHEVFARVAPQVAARTITLTAASKAFNLAGNRCALVHFGSPELRARLEAMTHRMVGEVSIMGHVATMAAWTDPESQVWFDEMLAYVDGNRRFLAETLVERIPQSRHAMPEATYLSWVDLSDCGLGDNPAEALLERGRLAVGIGPEYGSQGRGFIRVNLATSRHLLDEAVDRIVATIG